MIKYRSTLNCLLEMLLFPAVIILKLFLSLLDPVYKILFHVKPEFNFSLVQYFWRLKSQLFFSCLMTICLFVSHGFLLNLGITKMWASISCLLGNCCFFADNFCTLIFILCGFICCDYYYIWGDLWCQFQILHRNATPFYNFISLIWCTSKLSLCQTCLASFLACW